MKSGGKGGKFGRGSGHGSGRGARDGHRVRWIYEDEDIIAVEKPSGLAVIAPEGSRAKSLYDVVTDWIRESTPRGRAAVVHRLDRDSSGVMVFAKHGRAKKTLMESWNESVVLRRYVALAEGSPPAESGTFDTWLRENAGGTVYETAPGAQGALRALTNWSLVEEGNGFSLLELELETGRKHQIRAQLGAAGLPIVGDPRYGARSDPLGRLCLHASILELRQPRTGEILRFESPPPPEFAAQLRRGRKGG